MAVRHAFDHLRREFVDAELVLSVQKGACVVPAMAVTTGPAGSFVYVVGPDSTAASRPVTVDRLADDSAIIRSGLHEGELVITDGQARVSPGARVLIRTPARPASATRP